MPGNEKEYATLKAVIYMAHYFENDANQNYQAHTMSFELDGKTYSLSSSTGLFSHEKLDTGTRILLEEILKRQTPPKNLLDLGCGIGVVGVVLGQVFQCEVTCIDISEQASKIAAQNLKKYGISGEVLCQNGLSQEQGMYECIVLNPPIRTGKESIYALFEQAIAHLQQDGTFWIVMRKQHGAASALTFLESLDVKAKRVARDKGYWIIQVKKD
jgi:16S rRNA (guanine1207-N2)-methyltransferase